MEVATVNNVKTSPCKNISFFETSDKLHYDTTIVDADRTIVNAHWAKIGLLTWH